MSSRVQVLIPTMFQRDRSLVEKMNIRTPAVIANQGDYEGLDEYLLPSGEVVTFVSSATRGVGRNRNIALEHASEEICLIGDDDVVYFDDYEEKVLDAFDKIPDADLVFFNLDSPEGQLFQIEQDSRVRWWNFLRYGTARVAVRRSRIQEAGISFNEQFGGGTEHSHGEDTLFFADCLKHGLRIYAVSTTVGELTENRGSTWDNGNIDKYLSDQGALYRAMSPSLWRFWVLQDAVRRSRLTYQTSWREAFSRMAKGAKSYAPRACD